MKAGEYVYALNDLMAVGRRVNQVFNGDETVLFRLAGQLERERLWLD